MGDAVCGATAGQQSQKDGTDIQRLTGESQQWLRDDLVEIACDAVRRELQAAPCQGQHAGCNRSAGDACNLIKPRDDAEFIEACERAHVIDHGAVGTARKAEPYRVLYLGRGEEIVTCGMALETRLNVSGAHSE